MLLSTLACTNQPNNSILAGINQARLNNGLNQLQEKAELNAFAEYRLAKMQTPSHDNFKQDYLTFMHEYFVINNVQNAFYGEIIAFSQIQASNQEYINAWLNSPSHKETILRNYESFGIAEGFINGNYLIVVEFDLNQK
jgi:uncharacterized protein YkwD